MEMRRPGSGSQASTPSARNHWRATSPCPCSVSKLATIAASPYGRSSKAMPRSRTHAGIGTVGAHEQVGLEALAALEHGPRRALLHPEIHRLRAVRDGYVGQRGGMGFEGVREAPGFEHPRERTARPRGEGEQHAAVAEYLHAPHGRHPRRVQAIPCTQVAKECARAGTYREHSRVVRLAAGRGPPRRRLEHAHLAAGARAGERHADRAAARDEDPLGHGAAP